MLSPSLFCKYLFIVASLLTNLLAFPIQDAPVEENMIAERDAGIDGTTEGVMSAMWHKITNFFAPESSTPTFNLFQTEKPQGQLVRSARMSAPQTRKGKLHHDMRRMQKANSDTVFDEGGVVAPAFDENFGRLSRGIQYAKILENENPNVARMNQVRRAFKTRKLLFEIQLKSRRTDMEDVFRDKEGMEFIKKEWHEDNDKKPYIEEFEQGGADEAPRKKRFKDVLSNAWITEKISEGSDPVENIDQENYIEEIRSNPFLFHEPQFRPIVVENQLSDEPRTISQIMEEELPPIEIIDY